jgi:hypothetical protein
MTTEEVAARFGIDTQPVRKWALKNGVARVIGKGGIAAYDWTEKDCARFAKRPGKGRPKKQ